MKLLTSVRRFGQRHLAGPKDFTTEVEDSTRSELTDLAVAGVGGAAVGAGIGAGIGALVGRSRAISDYETSIEPTRVELSWQEPVMESQVLGQIPRDESVRPSLLNHLGFDSKPRGINSEKVDVVRTNPALNEDGQPVMSDVTQVFEGYGEADVEWLTNRVTRLDLKGYDRDVTSRYEGQWSCRRNWFPPEDKNVVEWCVDYDPKISKSQVGTYSSPKVKFERPDAVNSKIARATLNGALKGAGIGLATGLVTGVLGSVLMKSLATD